MKNIIIIFFCMFMLMFQATAQNHADVKEIEVSGIVLDSNKDPLIGANIVVKNVPGLGVITNIDGKFKIKVELYQRLIVSYIGFESQEILIKDKKTLTVIMQESKSSGTRPCRGLGAPAPVFTAPAVRRCRAQKGAPC